MNTTFTRLFARATMAVATTLLLIPLLCGCASFNSVRFDVEPSGLDFLVMSCHLPHDPTRTAWLQLTGSGFLEVRRGSSTRVTDDMWDTPDQANWDDFRANRIALNKNQTTDSFQWLVDSGFFDKNLKSATPTTNAVYFAVAAQIGFKKQRAIVTGETYSALFTALYQTAIR